MILIFPLFAAIAPLILWPLEQLLPYPHFLEEIFKSILIFFLLRENITAGQLKIVLLSGFLFGLTESVLYLFNIYLVGEFTSLILRLTLTTSLHILTFVIIFVLLKKGLLLGLVGTGLAIFIHYLFNTAISLIHP